MELIFIKHLKIKLGDTCHRNYKVACAQNNKHMNQVADLLIKQYIKYGDKLLEKELKL